MKLSLYRAIPLVFALDIAALLVSGVPRFKHAHHGLDAAVGEIVWLAFLAGLLALLVLAAIALIRVRRARRARSAGV